MHRPAALLMLTCLVCAWVAPAGAMEPARQSGRVAASLTTRDGLFVLAVTTRPDPLLLNEPGELLVEVRPAKPLEDRNPPWLNLQATMPAHGHGMNTRVRVEQQGGGRFVVKGLLLHMAGDWELLFQVAQGRFRDEARVALTLE